MMKVSAISILVHVFGLATLIHGQSPPPTPVIVWSEEFDYAPDGEAVPPNPNVWKYNTGRGPNNDGWGNGELQTYTDALDNVRVSKGNLYITAIGTGRDDIPFTSGRIYTNNDVMFKYGTITMKAKTPDVVVGLWPAFWTLGKDFETLGWPKGGEMNIMEMGQGLGISEGVGNRRVVSAAHWERNGEYATEAGWVDYSVDVNGTYHWYTLDWTPDAITTYIDDTRVWGMNIDAASCEDCEVFHDYHSIVLSLAVGGGFTSGGSSSSSAGCGSSSSAGSSGVCGDLLTPDDITAPLPGSLIVDWIRIFDNGNTTLTVSTPAPVVVPTNPAPVVVPTEPAPVVAPSEPNVVVPTEPAPVVVPTNPAPVEAPSESKSISPSPSTSATILDVTDRPVVAPTSPIAPTPTVAAPVDTTPIVAPVAPTPVAAPSTGESPSSSPLGDENVIPAPTTKAPTNFVPFTVSPAFTMAPLVGTPIIPMPIPNVVQPPMEEPPCGCPPTTATPTIEGNVIGPPAVSPDASIIFPPFGSGSSKGGKGSGKGGKGSDGDGNIVGPPTSSSKSGKGSGSGGDSNIIGGEGSKKGSKGSKDSSLSEETLPQSNARSNNGRRSATTVFVTTLAAAVLL